VGIDCVLVGDSLGMVFQGLESTLHVSLDEVVSALEKHRIYDELVSKEIAVELAEKLRAALDNATRTIPSQVLNNIASIAEQKLKLLSTAKSESEEEE
jgi:ketopantoate hydroxymethyltransferase